MKNHVLDRLAREDRRAGLNAEKEMIGRVDGKVHRGSGAMSTLKSDGTVGKFRIEAKSTKGQSLRIQKEWLKKIERESLPQGQIPMLQFSFTSEDGTVDGLSYCAIPEWALRELLDG